jgi:hypothetical protein
MVTRHGLPPTQHCVPRLRVGHFCNDNAWWGSILYTPLSAVFRRPSLVCKRLAYLLYASLLLLCHHSDFPGSFCASLGGFSSCFQLLSSFSPPFRWSSCRWSGLARHGSIKPIVFGLFDLLVRPAPPYVPELVLGAWLLGGRPAARGPAWKPRLPFSVLPEVVGFLWLCLLPRLHMTCSHFMWSWGSAGYTRCGSCSTAVANSCKYTPTF